MKFWKVGNEKVEKLFNSGVSKSVQDKLNI